jgi:hypothetical protein
MGMSQIEDLQSLVGQLPKSYRKESLNPIRNLLGQIALTDENTEAVYCALEPLQSPDLSKMLGDGWDTFSPSVRTHLVQLRRTGKGERVISGCSVLAAILAAKDPNSSIALLAEALFQAKGSDATGKSMLAVLRRDWLCGPSPLPFESLTWSQMASSWRWQFFYGLVNIILGDEPTKRPKLSDQARSAVMTWLRNLVPTEGVTGDDAKKLSALADRLDPKRQRTNEEDSSERSAPEPTPVSNPSTPAMVPSGHDEGKIREEQSIRPIETAPSRPLPLSPGQVPIHASEVTMALEQLRNLWHRYAKFVERSASSGQTITQVRELEMKLKEADRELDNEIANNQQLKRNLASAAEDIRRAKGETAGLAEQLTELRTRLTTVEPLADKAQLETEHLRQQVQELQSRLAGQEEGQMRHLQATLKEERRVFRVEIAQAIQSKVKQIQSLGERPAGAELVEAYRVVFSGLLGALESQGISVER